MQKLYIAMYHYTRDLKNSRYPSIRGLDYALFKKQLNFFEQQMQVVTMEDVIESIMTGKKLPEQAVLLTFDDGYIDNYTFALPALKERHMQGSFFIPGKTFAENSLLDVNKIHFILASSDDKKLKKLLLQRMDYYRGAEFDYPSNAELQATYEKASRYDTKETIFIKRMLQTALPESVRNLIASELFAEFVGIPEDKFARELYLNPEQIRLIKENGMYIGLHGYDHYWLGNLTTEQMNTDIDKALDVMGEFVDLKCWVMNYPYGNRDERVVEYVKSKGCIVGLTTDVRVADLDSDSRYEMPRFDCNDFPPKSDNYKKFNEIILT